MPTLQLLVAVLILGPGISGILGIPEVPALGRSPLERPLPLCSLAPPARGRGPVLAALGAVRGPAPGGGRVQPEPPLAAPQFVCSTRDRGCNLGSFAPERGPFCSFPWAGRELRSARFRLLVNPGGFEALDWVNASFGSVPEGAVEGCPLTDLFVGRSRDGLGKVSKEHQALFVAVDGEEIWYKWYQVLVVRQGPSYLSIGNVSYNGSAARESAEPALVAEAALRNPSCRPLPATATLQENAELERSWSAELPPARGVLRAAPPLLTDSGWELGDATAVPWAGGAAVTEFVRRQHEVRAVVPARSECSAVLRGLRRELRLPFSASLLREFPAGRPHRAPVAGWARSRAVTALRTGLERCRPLRGMPACPD